MNNEITNQTQSEQNGIKIIRCKHIPQKNMTQAGIPFNNKQQYEFTYENTQPLPYYKNILSSK